MDSSCVHREPLAALGFVVQLRAGVAQPTECGTTPDFERHGSGWKFRRRVRESHSIRIGRCGFGRARCRWRYLHGRAWNAEPSARRQRRNSRQPELLAIGWHDGNADFRFHGWQPRREWRWNDELVRGCRQRLERRLRQCVDRGSRHYGERRARLWRHDRRVSDGRYTERVHVGRAPLRSGRDGRAGLFGTRDVDDHSLRIRLPGRRLRGRVRPRFAELRGSAAAPLHAHGDVAKRRRGLQRSM